MNVRDRFFNTLYEKVGGGGEHITLITGDLAAPSLDRFREDFPGNYYSAGISEQNLISAASGMAAAGEKVIAYAANPFLITRTMDQLYNTVALMNLPVLIVGFQTGLSSASSGATHVVISDIALARTLQNVVTLTPSDLSLAEELFAEAFRFDKPRYLRFDKDVNYTLPRARTDLAAGYSLVTPGGEGAVVTCGRHVEILREIIAEMPAPRPALYDVFRVPFDGDKLAGELSRYGKIFTAEEQVLQGGLGSAVLECLADHGVGRPVRRAGINIERGYPEVFGNRAYMQRLLGLDGESLARSLAGFFAE